MRRRLRTILCFAPLIVCVPLWMFTFVMPLRARMVELFDYPNGALVANTIFELELEDGWIGVRCGVVRPPAPARFVRREFAVGLLMPEARWNGLPPRFGIIWNSTTYLYRTATGPVPRGTVRLLRFPFPYLLALLSIAPLVSLRRRYRRLKRRRLGLCVVCGYDLRGALQRCPECGSITASGSATSRVSG